MFWRIGSHNDESDLLGCWCFDNGATHVIDHVLLGHDGLLHVLVVTEHLLMVLIMTNMTSLDAGVLIMVRHMLLNMFFLVMMDSSMLVLSLSTWSGSSSWLPKCHVWHINQNPTIDRHLLVIVLGPKMHFYRIFPMLWGENVGWGAGVFPASDWCEIFFGTSWHIYLMIKIGFTLTHWNFKYQKNWGINWCFRTSCWLINLGSRI